MAPPMLEDATRERLTIESSAVLVHAGRRWSSVVGFASFSLLVAPLVVMMIGGGLFGMQKPDGWASFVGFSWMSAMCTGVLAGVLRASEVARRGSVSIDLEGLTIVRGSSRLVVPVADVVGGSVTPRPDGAVLMLSLADGRLITAMVPSEEAGARALEALRIDPLGRPLVSRFAGGLLRGVLGLVVGIALIGVGAWLKSTVDLRPVAGAVWAALFVALTAGWLSLTRPPEIAVGADGVRIRGKVGSRFVELGRIASARVESSPAPLGASTLVLELRSGATERIQVAAGNGPMLHAACHRIERAIERTSEERAAARQALLQRGTRTFAAWKDALSALVRDAGYRRATLAVDELERIVGSSGVATDQRIGAALALRECGGSLARHHIRIAAEQCVNPQVRFALERIADGEATSEAEAEAVEEAIAAGEAEAGARGA